MPRGAYGEAIVTAQRTVPSGPVSGGAIGETRSRTYGEALVTGQRAGAEGLGERRCIGEVPQRGREAHRGIPGGRPPWLTRK